MSKPSEFENYMNAGDTWDREIFANMQQSRNRAWLLSFFCMGIAILSLITLVLVLPLKTFEPYVVSHRNPRLSPSGSSLSIPKSKLWNSRVLLTKAPPLTPYQVHPQLSGISTIPMPEIRNYVQSGSLMMGRLPIF